MPVWLILKGLFGSAAGWLSRRSLIELACMALAIFAGVQRFQLADARSDALRWHKQFDAEHKAREDDRKAYIQAQADAAAKNKADVQRIEKQQDAINEKVRSDYRRDLDRLRSRTNQGSSGEPSVSQDGNSPGGADADGLPLSGSELLQAQEIELRLMHLQNWIEQQLKPAPSTPQ